MQTWTDVHWLARAPAQPAEGPLWDSTRRVVWWVDIMQHHVHAWERDTGNDRVIDVGEPVGSLALRGDGSLLLALQTRLAFLDPDSRVVETFVDLEADHPATRANDGKAGPDGAFWIGTMALDGGWEEGSFYRVTADGAVQRLLSGVSISNGMDWLADGRLYYIDSYAGGVDLLEVDIAAGVVCGRARVVDVPPEVGLPDGMTLDAEGCLWVAIHNGSQIRRYSPEGEHVGEVRVPAALVTSCAFGGPDLRELYITVAGQDGDGGLLRCDVGIAGRPPYRFAG